MNARFPPLRGVLPLAAVAEVLTGLSLLLAPALVARLLLGIALTQPFDAVARVAGIALVGLGLACWPGPPRFGMLVYGAGVAVYLTALGLTGTAGPLLWPAVALHALLSLGLFAGLSRSP
jgi:hypothetical protein